MNTLFLVLAVMTLVSMSLFLIDWLRMNLISRPIFSLMQKMNMIPRISETEVQAIEAGGVGPEREFFTGYPDLEKLKNIHAPKLTNEEESFIFSKDGPVERLCKMTDDYVAWKENDFSEYIWSFMKKNKFFGMIIPRKYEGLGFSHYAQALVLQKLASRSAPLSVTVMVPNSLGPAELLLNYGTDQQKEYYLPKLATGEEIPCFGLTEPEAGSDATSLKSSGVIFKEGNRNRIKLNFEKRWITLNTRATLIGLAFRLKDPDHILGNKDDLGITIALVPADTEGIDSSQRHDPLYVPFTNGPLFGKDVIIDMDDIIGGADYIGRGWQMISECLSAGRGVSLPSHYTGSAKMCCTYISAHANLRYQFGLPIGKFEGVKAALARMFGLTYIMEATNKQVLGFMHAYGVIPVVSAIAKYNLTELGRIVVNDAMDISGGTGISRGPQNRIANHYISAPIGITVEGANILTRTLIIFGQGALRSHPYSYGLIKSISNKDLNGFDQFFWKFTSHFMLNYYRSTWHSLTRGRLIRAKGSKLTKRYYQKLMWTSSRFAFLSDFVMMSYGGKLKFSEHMTGRFADLLSWQLIGLSTLNHFETSKNQYHQLSSFHYAMEEVFYNIQIAFEEIYRNIKVPVAQNWFHGVGLALIKLSPIGSPQNDDVINKLAYDALEETSLRKDFQYATFIPIDESDPLARVERAYLSWMDCKISLEKIKKAQKVKKLTRALSSFDLYKRAFDNRIINKREFDKLNMAESERLLALSVFSHSTNKEPKGQDLAA